SRSHFAPASSQPACATNNPSSARENSARASPAHQRTRTQISSAPLPLSIPLSSPISMRSPVPRSARLSADSSKRNKLDNFRLTPLAEREETAEQSSVMRIPFTSATGFRSSTTSRKRVFHSIAS